MRALQDKIAIATGAGRGTGRALALKLASAGARLVVNDVSEAPAAEVVQAIREAGGNADSPPMGPWHSRRWSPKKLGRKSRWT